LYDTGFCWCRLVLIGSSLRFDQTAETVPPRSVTLEPISSVFC
jgi:hypothetical protein